ncbi:MAG: sigma-70 domain-containing protein [Lachnospiraceae bacterium]
METKLEFRASLNHMLEIAKEKENVLSIQEIEAYFEQDGLSKEQMELLCDYLLSQKVAVTGYVKMGGTVKPSMTESSHLNQEITFTEDEEAYLKEYIHDLEQIKPEQLGERISLVKQLLEQDKDAKQRLIELYLPEVVPIAKCIYQEEGLTGQIFIGDMIQEGNLGLTLAIQNISKEEGMDEIIKSAIKLSIQMLLEEQRDVKSRDSKLVHKVNYVNEGIENLTKELGRKISTEELAVYLDMTEEEILDTLKLAGEDLEEETDD